MKHLISPIANGGAPIYLDDLINGDLENKKAYEAILAGLDSKIVLSGCEVTITGPGTCDITAGYVYINGTVMEVPTPYSGSYPVYIHEATAVNDDRDFEDGNTDTVAITQTAEFTGSPSGDNIEFNPTTGYRLSTVLKRASFELEDIRLVHDLTGKFDGTGLGYTYNVERGFALCNGNNGTPDLTGKFIVGYDDTTVGDYDTIGKTGGEETHTLTQAELPNVNFPYSIDKESGGALGSSGSFASTAAGGTGAASNLTISSGGSDQPHENRPPYYVLAYVMKVS